MNQASPVSQWGSFALVGYILDPLRSFLYELQQTMPAAEVPQPHITVLPRRPLLVPIEAASEQARRVLENFAGFEVELSDVSRFPETNVLYIDVSKGKQQLHDMHDSLNSGDLAHQEEFAFRPHLTLGLPLPTQNDGVRDRIEAVWDAAPVSKRFTIDEIVFLWLSPHSTKREWHRVWAYNLNTKKTELKAAAHSAAALTNQRS